MSAARWLVVLPLAVACTAEPPKGTQIGAIRKPDPAPAPPTDLTDLDMSRAVEDALALAGLVTTQSAFAGHLATLGRSTARCPTVWAGLPPENLVELEIDNEDAEGLSWLDDCTTNPGGETFDGFAFWTTTVDDGVSASRQLVADAVVGNAAGDVLWSFDGEASDTLDLETGAYASSFAGEITGTLAALGEGLRAQNNTASDNGGFLAEWGPDGSLHFSGSVEAFDGFGPDDTRTGNEPELQSIVGWKKGQRRFTSVRFDLTFGPECAEEPLGFVGLRGNEGFWFDLYFLPIYPVDEDTAQSNAFPFERIENQTCDGIGTLFSRNVDLAELDAGDDGWSREIAPDFAAARATLPAPSVESYIYTLRHLPEE